MGKLAVLGARTGFRKLRGEGDDGSLAELLTDRLGTLRGVALKLGQMASYVDGIIPDAQREVYERSLARLRNQASTMSAADAATVVAQELGASPRAIFERFESEPFASASIGQVHRATYRDPQRGPVDVAVKIQHQGVQEAVEADLANGRLLGGLMGPLGGKFGLNAQLAELRARLTEELDYRHEAAAQERFRRIFEGEPKLRIPRVIAERSARRVLTTTFAPGIGFEAAMQAPEAARKAWAETLFRFVFGSVLREGLLNADPQPGNYLFEDDGVVHALDFGCTRQLSPERLEFVRQVHRACVRGDDADFVHWAMKLVDMEPGSEQGQLAQAYVLECFRPVRVHAPFRFTRAFAGNLVGQLRGQAAFVARAKADTVRPLPAELLFFNRLQVGFYSVLARLDVELDYFAIHADLVKQLDAPKP